MKIESLKSNKAPKSKGTPDFPLLKAAVIFDLPLTLQGGIDYTTTNSEKKAKVTRIKEIGGKGGGGRGGPAAFHADSCLLHLSPVDSVRAIWHRPPGKASASHFFSPALFFRASQ
ncbi:hypothetical protein J6590_046722 [Homalodisca vitripennis]|nr:hypothetical protein J6590_046722 [Homalodisca vitripennis]